MDQLDKIRILGFQGGNAICLLMVTILLSYFLRNDLNGIIMKKGSTG